MSHDVSVNCHTCGNALNHAHTSLPAGCKGLFEDLGAPIYDWSGKTGVHVLSALQSAITQLENETEYYRERHDGANLANDWSRVDFALPFLKALRDGICRDPWAVIHVL